MLDRTTVERYGHQLMESVINGLESEHVEPVTDEERALVLAAIHYTLQSLYHQHEGDLEPKAVDLLRWLDVMVQISRREVCK